MNKYETDIRNDIYGQQVAIIDLEFGAVPGVKNGSVYGGIKTIIPLEVGIICHDENINSVCYSRKEFIYDINVELWKNTDKYGNKIKPECSVVNIKKNEYNKQIDKDFKLNHEQREKVSQIEIEAHQNLRYFVNDILETNNINKLVFFDDHMDISILKNAKIDVPNYFCIDVQKEIKKRYNIEQGLSLDKISHAINFRNTEKNIKSSNFEYKIPSKFKSLIEPHKALGDSARTFLIYKEFNKDGYDFKKIIDTLL